MLVPSNKNNTLLSILILAKPSQGIPTSPRFHLSNPKWAIVNFFVLGAKCAQGYDSLQGAWTMVQETTRR